MTKKKMLSKAEMNRVGLEISERFENAVQEVLSILDEIQDDYDFGANFHLQAEILRKSGEGVESKNICVASDESGLNAIETGLTMFKNKLANETQSISPNTEAPMDVCEKEILGWFDNLGFPTGHVINIAEQADYFSKIIQTAGMLRAASETDNILKMFDSGTKH